MTKIYEALEQAGQIKKNSDDEYQKDKNFSKNKKIIEEGSIRQSIFIRSSNHRINQHLERPLDSLYHNIKTLLPEKRCRIIQLMSARPGEGTAFYTHEFGKLCAWKYGKKVLLVSLEKGIGGQHEVQNSYIVRKRNQDDKENASSSYHSLMVQVDDTPLYAINLGLTNIAMQLDSESEEVNDFFDSIIEEFDFILINLPANLLSSDFLLLSNKTDGVIILVEAEKTRWHVVEHLSNKIKNQGVNVLGVLLNKRKFYVPKILYKFL